MSNRNDQVPAHNQDKIDALNARINDKNTSDADRAAAKKELAEKFNSPNAA